MIQAAARRAGSSAENSVYDGSFAGLAPVVHAAGEGTTMRRLSIARTSTNLQAHSPARHVDCQVCRCSKSVDEAIVLWREDAVVLAVCHQCTRDHDIVMRPNGTGVQVLAKLRGAA